MQVVVASMIFDFTNSIAVLAAQQWAMGLALTVLLKMHHVDNEQTLSFITKAGIKRIVCLFPYFHATERAANVT